MAPKQHGTCYMYNDGGCRCDECRKAKWENQRAIRRYKNGGRDFLTDAEPVREHVKRLLDGGMGIKTIARESGVYQGFFRRLLRGDRSTNGKPTQKVQTERAERVLAVRLKLHKHQNIDATQTWEYLDEMIACGLTRRQIASALAGKPVKNLQIGKPYCEFKTAQKVEALHWSLWKTTPAFRLRCSHEPPAYVVDELRAS